MGVWGDLTLEVTSCLSKTQNTSDDLKVLVLGTTHMQSTSNSYTIYFFTPHLLTLPFSFLLNTVIQKLTKLKLTYSTCHYKTKMENYTLKLIERDEDNGIDILSLQVSWMDISTKLLITLLYTFCES